MTVIKGLLKITAEKVGFTIVQEKHFTAVIFVVNNGNWKLFWVLSYCNTVDKEDDGRKKEHEQEKENISLHCD